MLGLCVIERYRSDWRKVGSILVAMMVAAIFFRADYNASGFALIVMLYVLLSIAGTRRLYDAADEMGGRSRLYSYRDVQR